MSRGLKRGDLTKCVGCGRGLLAGGPIVYRLTLERFGIDPHAVQRAHGLDLMIGAPLASIMGPDEDIGKPIDGDVSRVLVCGDCVVKFPAIVLTSE